MQGVIDETGSSPRLPSSHSLATGRAYWRSLDQLADTPEFRDWVDRRFPRSMMELLSGGIDRRRFLQLISPLAACSSPCRPWPRMACIDISMMA